MAVSVSVTVTQVDEDGTEVPLDGELAAALAGTAGQFTAMIAWAAGDAAGLDHGDREKEIGESGRELQRRLLEAKPGRVTPADARGDRRPRLRLHSYRAALDYGYLGSVRRFTAGPLTRRGSTARGDAS